MHVIEVIYHDMKVCSPPLKTSSHLEKGAFWVEKLGKCGVAAEIQKQSAGAQKSTLDRRVLVLNPLLMLAVWPWPRPLPSLCLFSHL